LPVATTGKALANAVPLLGATVGEVDLQSEMFGAVGEEGAVAEQIEWRKASFAAAQPRRDRDVGSDAAGSPDVRARGFAMHQRYSIIAALRTSCR
jgi:hypothetical protein